MCNKSFENIVFTYLSIIFNVFKKLQETDFSIVTKIDRCIKNHL